MRRVHFFQLCLIGTVLIGSLACADPTDGKPEAAVADVQHDATPVAEGQTLIVSSESTIGFVGSKVTGSHDGGFKSFTGEIVLVDNDPTKSNIQFTIDTMSLWADDDRLTGHLKSADFFDVEANPVSTFASTEIVMADGMFTVTGNLDLHGVQKSITFPATIEVAEGSVTVSSEFSIKRFDFGIEYKGKADDLIRDDVLIQINLIAAPE
jgi:polyisoprenoid-binding protein YceI